MAQFLLAKFLSQALEWKYTHPNDPFYKGLAYEPYIFKKAREVFLNYSKLYEKDRDFTVKIALGLQIRDPNLVRIIYPKTLTPEMATQDKQFQQDIQAAQPRLPFRFPKIPESVRRAALDAGSAMGRIFQRNIGKHVTFGRAVAIAGGFAAGVASGGNPVAIAMGAGAGLVGSSYLGSPEGKNFLSNIGQGNVNSQRRPQIRRPKKSWLKGGRLLLLISGVFIGFMLFQGITGGPITPTGEAAPVPGNVGIGNTGLIANIPPSSPISSLACSTSMSVRDINTYFDKNGYVNFQGTGQAFYDAAQIYKINPAFVIAIGIQESNLGMVYKGKDTEKYHNAFGLIQGNSLMRFNAWAEGVSVAFKTVASFNCSTIECIASKYAPVGASNDPANLNQYWAGGVTSNFNSVPQSSCIPTQIAQIGPDRPSGWPTVGIITEGPFEGFSHQNPPQNAVDLANDARTSVYSTLNGEVTELVKDNPGSGYGVRVAITNKQTGAQVLFAHMIPQSDAHLKLGQTINKGDLIGLMDSTGKSTGSHLHYEIRGSLSKEQFGRYVPGGKFANKTVIKQAGNPGEWTPK